MGPKMRTTLYGFIASMRTPKALVAARAENADLVVQLREARAQTAEEADKAVKTHLMLSERDRQESVFLKTKLSNLEHDLELRDRELSTLRRQLTAIYPFVIPVEYGIQDKPAKQQRWTGLLLSNDGGRVAYDVEMIPFKVGKWTVTLEPVLRMELGQKTPAFLDVRCDTVGESDLLRHIAEFQRAADSLGEPIPFEIRYRDADWNRFTSFCEFRIVAAFGADRSMRKTRGDDSVMNDGVCASARFFPGAFGFPFRGDSSFASCTSTSKRSFGNREHSPHDFSEVLKFWRRVEGWFPHTSPEAGLRLPRPRLCMFITGASLLSLQTPSFRSVHCRSNACRQFAASRWRSVPRRSCHGC